MLIEIIGLPGVGKTTLVEALCSNKMIFHKKIWMSMDDVLFDWYKLHGNRKKMMLLNFLIHFTIPSFIGRQLKLKMIRTIKTCAYNQLNELNDHYTPCCAAFIKAISSKEDMSLKRIHSIRSLERAIIINRIAEQFFHNKLVLLDEGLALRVIPLTLLNVPLDTIRHYFDALPAANAYVIMTLNNECLQQERLLKRGEGKDRTTFLTKRNPPIRDGLNCLIDIMNGRGIPMLEIDAEHSLEENTTRVEEFVQGLTSAEGEKPSKDYPYNAF